MKPLDPPSFPEPVEVTGLVQYPEGPERRSIPGHSYFARSVSFLLQSRVPDLPASPGPCTAGYAYPYRVTRDTTIRRNRWPVTGTLSSLFRQQHLFLPITPSATMAMQHEANCQHHLDSWYDWNTVGGDPFGTTFVGKPDMDHIGTLGHSRGRRRRHLSCTL